MKEFDDLEDMEVMAGFRHPDDLTRLAMKCADDGVCHHDCVSNSKENCFRQCCCGPLGQRTWEEINKLAT